MKAILWLWERVGGHSGEREREEMRARQSTSGMRGRCTAGSSNRRAARSGRHRAEHDALPPLPTMPGMGGGHLEGDVRNPADALLSTPHAGDGSRPM